MKKGKRNVLVDQSRAKFQQAFQYHQSGQLAQAQLLYDEILQLQPRHFDSLHLSGVVASQTKNFHKAVELIGKAIEICPDNAIFHSNYGNTLKELKQYEAAVASYDRAIALKPGFAEAWNNRGVALEELREYEAAVAGYDQAISLKPDYAEAYSNRGNVLKEIGHYEAAVASYDRAIALKPDYAEAYSNRGSALKDLRHYEAAVASYERAILLSPDYDFLFGQWLHTKMKICDWKTFEDDVDRFRESIKHNKKASPPFPLLALIDSPALHKHAAEIYAQAKFLLTQHLPEILKGARHKKIRIGYYSADYRNHAVMHLMAELFEQHDRGAFEVIAFSFGPNREDEMRKRAAAAFDRFIDVRHLSDIDVVHLSRNLEIDIAIDLGGFTAHSRTGIFALRAAPIQASYIGYLGTTGISCIDYLIADPVIIPEESRQHFCEKIVYLPSYQVNDTKRRIANTLFTREELGLPEQGFVFCCFNNSYKITPGTFAGWMRILQQVEESVLFLYVDNDVAQANLKREAESRGVSGKRLIFGQRLPLAEHLARYRVADLFLDTLPYNAGATASDALWAGLPVLTCMGKAFSGRVAASLLNAIQLPELITSTQEEYEALAVELATNPKKLTAIQQKLEQNRLTTPLFDTKLFTRHIEAAYTAMYERCQEGLSPEHIVVLPVGIRE